eukprot:5102078-Pleurochrysis_carterae.AAC.13
MSSQWVCTESKPVGRHFILVSALFTRLAFIAEAQSRRALGPRRRADRRPSARCNALSGASSLRRQGHYSIFDTDVTTVATIAKWSTRFHEYT